MSLSRRIKRSQAVARAKPKTLPKVVDHRLVKRLGDGLEELESRILRETSPEKQAKLLEILHVDTDLMRLVSSMQGFSLEKAALAAGRSDRGRTLTKLLADAAHLEEETVRVVAALEALKAKT